MYSEFFEQAHDMLTAEPNYSSHDLADLARVYAKYSNWLHDEAESGDNENKRKLLDTVLSFIENDIICNVMENEGYFLNTELTTPQWEKS